MDSRKDVDAAPVDAVVMRAVSDPPGNCRRVIMRFGDNGERDCEGFYWSAERSWYKSEGSKARRNAVHPTHWAEKRDCRYQVVEYSGRVVFDDCTYDEAAHFKASLPAVVKAMIVPVSA